MDKIIDLVVGKFPEMIIIVIVSMIVWLVAKFYFRRFVPVEDKIKDHDSVIDKIVESIRNIEAYIMKKDKSAIDGLFRKFSPYTLTDAGLKLIEISGAKKCVDENIDFFADEIQKLKPKAALDVEDNALSVLNWNTSNEIFNQIKDFVYNAPKPYVISDDNGNSVVLEEAITLSVILLVTSIYLRDKYFEKHPEFLKDTTK